MKGIEMPESERIGGQNASSISSSPSHNFSLLWVLSISNRSDRKEEEGNKVLYELDNDVGVVSCVVCRGINRLA